MKYYITYWYIKFSFVFFHPNSVILKHTYSTERLKPPDLLSISVVHVKIMFPLQYYTCPNFVFFRCKFVYAHSFLFVVYSSVHRFSHRWFDTNVPRIIPYLVHQRYWNHTIAFFNRFIVATRAWVAWVATLQFGGQFSFYLTSPPPVTFVQKCIYVYVCTL